MARSGDGDEIWGTWEELLLAGAVGRHGTGDWGSVAAAVGERTPFPHLLTAEVCERRYRDLCRRFQGEAREAGGGSPSGDACVVPWLEELRGLRVAELRREVHRYDVSIVSLQKRVRRLMEERERSLRDQDDGPDAAGANAADQEENHRKINGHLPDTAGGGEGSGRSCNESNSPESKHEGQARKPEKPTDEEEEEETTPAKAVPVAGGEDKVAGEGSCNGSSETVVMGKGSKAVTGAGDAGAPTIPRPPDSGESMAESTGEEATKESSDVQSSASPSRRRKPQGERGKPMPTSVSGGNSEGDSPEAKVDHSSKSQPLFVLLEIIRSSKYGSVFERRLDSQDNVRYRSLIRQHMDVEIIGKRLEEGSYTSTEFFRDLLLICANAAVFFPKDSLEHSAAVHLRKLVGSKLAPFNPKPALHSPPEAPAPAAIPPQLPVAHVAVPPRPPQHPRQPQSATVKPKSEPETHTSLLDKVTPTPPLGACRKRSSISAKNTVAVAVVKAAGREDAVPVSTDEKSELEKEPEIVDKKVMKEKPPVARGLRTTKTRGPMTKKPSLPGSDATIRPKAEEKESDATEPAKAPAEKRTLGNSTEVAPPPTAPVAKKRSAASFLNRLREVGGPVPSTNGETQPAKNVEVSGAKAGVENKKGAKEERKKEKQEPSGPAKRSVGRPPKRPPPTPPSQPPAKRVKEAEADPPARPQLPAATKKRGRR